MRVMTHHRVIEKNWKAWIIREEVYLKKRGGLVPYEKEWISVAWWTNVVDEVQSILQHNVLLYYLYDVVAFTQLDLKIRVFTMETRQAQK